MRGLGLKLAAEQRVLSQNAKVQEDGTKTDRLGSGAYDRRLYHYGALLILGEGPRVSS